MHDILLAIKDTTVYELVHGVYISINIGIELPFPYAHGECILSGFDEPMITCLHWPSKDITTFPNHGLNIREMVNVSLGETLYCLGGINENGNEVNTVLKYNEEWTKIKPMLLKRRHHSVLAVDGYIIVCGGWGEAGTSVEMYNPETDAWVMLPSMHLPRWDCSLLHIGSKFYAIGGSYIESYEIYDPLTKIWTVVEYFGREGSTHIFQGQVLRNYKTGLKFLDSAFKPIKTVPSPPRFAVVLILRDLK